MSVIVGFALSASANAQLSDVMRLMEGNNKTLSSVKADVTMTKCDSALGECDEMKGKTQYLPESVAKKLYVRIDWSTPAVEYVAIQGDKYELWRPKLNQVVQGTVQKAKSSSSAGNALGFMNMNREQLRKNYEVVYIGLKKLSDGTEAAHLQLTPKTAVSYKLAELWVDGNGMPRQGKIIERNNDTTTVLLTNIKKNEMIKASAFKLPYDNNKVKKIPG